MWLLNIGLSHLEERGERYAHVEEIGGWTADDNDVDRWRYGFSSTGPAKEADPFQKLGLSADQRTKLDTAKNERMTSLSATQQKVIAIRQKLMSLVADKKAQDREIDKIADEWAAADREALKTETKFYKAIRQILTQEQLTKLSKGDGK